MLEDIKTHSDYTKWCVRWTHCIRNFEDEAVQILPQEEHLRLELSHGLDLIQQRLEFLVIDLHQAVMGQDQETVNNVIQARTNLGMILLASSASAGHRFAI
jgi:hypothetical protein